jgi:hypothetical protein
MYSCPFILFADYIITILDIHKRNHKINYGNESSIYLIFHSDLGK